MLARPKVEEKTEPAAETVNIVRYPNRRLYDRSQGRYVTLEEIAAMVREGKTVSVRDSKSSQDLTSTILMQIVLEHHPERMDLLPQPILHLMIRTNDIVLSLLRDYFRQSLAYVDLWQQVATFNPVATSVQWLKSLLPSSPTGSATAPPGGGTDAETLAQRIAEMERRLKALEPSGGDKPGDAAGTSAGKRRRPDGRSGRSRIKS